MYSPQSRSYRAEILHSPQIRHHWAELPHPHQPMPHWKEPLYPHQAISYDIIQCSRGPVYPWWAFLIAVIPCHHQAWIMVKLSLILARGGNWQERSRPLRATVDSDPNFRIRAGIIQHQLRAQIEYQRFRRPKCVRCQWVEWTFCFFIVSLLSFSFFLWNRKASY